MDNSDYDIIYLILCQLLRVLSYSTGMIVSYSSPEVSKICNTGSVAQKKHTSVHILKSPCFETNKGEGFRKMQSIDTLKYLFNEEKLEKYFKIPHLYRRWLKVSFN